VLFRDDFDDGVTGSAWEVIADPGMTTLEETGRVHVRYAPSVPASTYGGYASTFSRDLSGACVTIDVSVVASPAADVDTFLAVGGAPLQLSITAQDGRLEARSDEGDGAVRHGSAPYDPIAHRFWRIRDAGTSIHYEVSEDGVRWTSLGILSEPVGLSSATLFFGTGAYLAADDAGDAQFESLVIVSP
jgi:hypothetical protein